MTKKFFFEPTLVFLHILKRLFKQQFFSIQLFFLNVNNNIEIKQKRQVRKREADERSTQALKPS